MKQGKYPIVNIGTVSILTIFVILCMVTFATLSYMSASHDQELGQKIADRTTAYYKASASASEKIAETDSRWNQAYEEDPSHFAGQEVSFSIPVDEGSALEVSLLSTVPEDNDGKLYRITRYAKVSTADWEGDDTLNLMKPEKE